VCVCDLLQEQLPFLPFSFKQGDGSLRTTLIPREKQSQEEACVALRTGLPDFSWNNIQKREKYTK
jgi:hypothetical protein